MSKRVYKIGIHYEFDGDYDKAIDTLEKLINYQKELDIKGFLLMGNKFQSVLEENDYPRDDWDDDGV